MQFNCRGKAIPPPSQKQGGVGTALAGTPGVQATIKKDRQKIY